MPRWDNCLLSTGVLNSAWPVQGALCFQREHDRRYNSAPYYRAESQDQMQGSR